MRKAAKKRPTLRGMKKAEEEKINSIMGKVYLDKYITWKELARKIGEDAQSLKFSDYVDAAAERSPAVKKWLRSLVPK